MAKESSFSSSLWRITSPTAYAYPLPTRPIKSHRICIDLMNDLGQKWGGHVQLSTPVHPLATPLHRGCHAYDDKHAEMQDAWPGNARLLSWFKSTYNKARLKSLKVSNSTTGRLDSAKQNRPNSTSDALSTQSTYEHAYSPTNYEGRLSFGSNYTVNS